MPDTSLPDTSESTAGERDGVPSVGPIPRDARTRARDAQRRWAGRLGIGIDAQGYVHHLEDNLFCPLTPETRAAYGAGRGDELGSNGTRGKMQALHSSAALVVNAFDPWRGRSTRPLEGALGLPHSIRKLEFERTFRTMLRGTPPHLDLALTLTDGSTVAIESKFLEPYPGRHLDGPVLGHFASSYFPDDGSLWRDLGLPGCQLMAAAMDAGMLRFRHLDVPQLLKHALGLAHTVEGSSSLWYLWYDVGGAEGAQHRLEISVFAQWADEALAFRSLSYQELWDRLEESGNVDADYLAYVKGRYGRLPEVPV